MKTIKRTVCLLLVLVLCVGIMPGRAMAASSKNGNYKLVALTFDDGPGPYTARLLDALKQRGAKATFFMLGERLAGSATYRSYAKRMVDEGHQIANHSYSHPALTTLSNANVTSQITRTRTYLVQAGGNQTYYVRPPYGDFNSRVSQLVGAPMVYWSVDPLDWKYRNSTTVYNNIMRTVKDGDIILLHDIHSTSVDAAIRVIDTLQARGYEFVTVSELLRRRGITPANGKMYYSAPNKGINLGPIEEEKEPEPEPEPDPEYYDESKIKQHWAYWAIEEVLERGIFSGIGKGKFGPNMYMRRGMFATVLGNYDGHGAIEASPPFTDVKSADYFAGHVTWAYENGIVSGYNNGKFGPNNVLTREQAAVILVNYLHYRGLIPAGAGQNGKTFKDSGKISAWAKNAVNICTELQIISGYTDGNFGPGDTLTRAQGAVLMLKMDAYMQTAERPAADETVTE